MLRWLFRIAYLLAVFSLIFNTVHLPVLGVSPNEFFVMLALAIWGVAYVRYRGGSGWGVPAHPLWLPALLILCGGLISSFGAVNLGSSFLITLKLFFVLTVWVAMGILMVRWGDVYAVLRTFVAAMAFTSAIAVADRLTGWDWGGKISGRTALFWNRSDGTVGHPVELAFVACSALPVVLGLLLDEWNTRRRLWLVALYCIALGVISAAIFLSGSVTGWAIAAMTVGLMFLIFVLRASNRVRFVLFWLVLLLVGTASLYLSEPTRWANFQFLLDFNLGRASGLTGPQRAGLVDEAIGVIAQNPLIGAGMDQSGTGSISIFDKVTSETVHNVLIGGWLGGGLFAAIGIVACYAVGLITALHAMRHGFRTMNWVVIGLAVSVIGWILFDQTQPHLYHRNTWLVLALLFGLGYTIRIVLPRARFAAGANLNADSARGNYLQAEP